MEPVKTVTGKTKLLGVIGNPIEHSISPELHNTLSAVLGNDIIYLPFRVDTGNIGKAVEGLKTLGFLGFNVTIPFKEKVIEYLHQISREAELIGAVNTVKITDGKLYGFNTDAEGFYRSFRRETETGFENKQVILLGAGGASRAISIKAALEGASKVYIVNRSIEKAENISTVINQNIDNIAKACGYECMQKIAPTSDIIINTTPLGMYPDIGSSPVNDSDFLKFFKEGQIIVDIIYNPVKSRFLLNGEKLGLRTVNGLGMLFYQGIYAYEIWTGKTIEDEVLDKVYNAYLKVLVSRE